ncbi:MAG: bifunctional YncE family protein/alkaline phosphatase family protein [Actinomycetota bacterium]
MKKSGFLTALGALFVMLPLTSRAVVPLPTLFPTTMPNGWSIDPAGTQVTTSRAPTGLTIGPDGAAYAVTSGIFEESIDRIDPTTLVATKTLVGQAYKGVAASGDGYVWVSGGPSDMVYAYRNAGPALVSLSAEGPVPAVPSNGIKVAGYPGAMLLEGSNLFVASSLSTPSSACDRGSSICSAINVIDVSNPLAQSPSVSTIPVGRNAFDLAYRASSNTLYVSNFADQTNSLSSNPFAGSGTVSVVQKNLNGTWSQVQLVQAGLGPSGIAISPDGSSLAVADAESDQLSLYSVSSDGSLTPAKTVDLKLGPNAPLGTAPLAVKYSSDGSFLYVTLAGINAIEILNADGSAIPQTIFSDPAETIPATFIPTGWYPDALALGSSNGNDRLFVANLRGDGSGPGYYAQTSVLVGTRTEGSVSVIDIPSDPSAKAAAFKSWTERVVAADQSLNLYGNWGIQGPDGCTPTYVPGHLGLVKSDVLCEAQQGTLTSRIGPIHVVMILAENKTFDAYFGDTKADLPTANSNPAFTEYGIAATPNQHALADSFTLSDNFYNEGAESSVLGHSWFSGGYTTVENELFWGMNYDEGLRGGRDAGQYAGNVTGAKHDPEVSAQESIMNDPRTRLADEVHNAGLSSRIYSTDLNRSSVARADQLSSMGSFWGEGSGAPTDTDLSFPDSDRANLFLHGTTTSHAWDLLQGPPPPTFNQTYPASSNPFPRSFTLDQWNADYSSCIAGGGDDKSCQSTMPAFIHLSYPENHTYYLEATFNPLDPTPQSMVADNDYAIGKTIEGLSHSPFWKNTIVFLSEDDNQYTGDHVDVHRTFLLTMGGLARRAGVTGNVSHQRGSFPSILKTIEVLLGLKPLTLFDWTAAPLQDVMAPNDSPINNAPYTAVVPIVPFLGRGVG